MSGDNLEYLEYRLQDLAHMILRRAQCAEHRAFGKHLMECADAAIKLSYVWSDDCSPGDELELIRKAVGPSRILAQTIVEARAAADKLREELEKVQD